MSDPESGHTAKTGRRPAVLQDAASVPGSAFARLESWVDELVRGAAGGRGELVVRLVGDDEMRHLNGAFRSRDGVTDVLSFPGDRDSGEPHLGDIVICVPVASDQAEESGHSLLTELKVLTLHGLLHCMGYDHERDDGEMEALELTLRRQWIDVQEARSD